MKHWNTLGWDESHGNGFSPPDIVNAAKTIRLTACTKFDTRPEMRKNLLPSSIAMMGEKILTMHPKTAFAGSLQTNW